MKNGSHETEGLIQTRRGEDGKPDNVLVPPCFFSTRWEFMQPRGPRYTTIVGASWGGEYKLRDGLKWNTHVET